MICARDVMSTDVVTVARDAPIREVAETLVRHRISAVPVTAGNGRVLGIISEGDFLRRVELGTDKRRSSRWQAIFADRKELASDYVRSHAMKAGGMMTRPVIAATEATPLTEIADMFERHKIKRVPVIQDGRLKGIVSRADLVRALVAQRGELEPAPRAGDRALRDAVYATLRKEDWFDESDVNIVVVDGTVQLWGTVDSDKERLALRIGAKTTPGVHAVEDHLSTGIRKDIGIA